MAYAHFALGHLKEAANRNLLVLRVVKNEDKMWQWRCSVQIK